MYAQSSRDFKTAERACHMGRRPDHVARVTAFANLDPWNVCSCLLAWTLLIHAAWIMLPCMTLRLFSLQGARLRTQGRFVLKCEEVSTPIIIPELLKPQASLTSCNHPSKMLSAISMPISSSGQQSMGSSSRGCLLLHWSQLITQQRVPTLVYY